MHAATSARRNSHSTAKNHAQPTLHAPRAQSVVCPPLHVRRETAGVLPERGLTELGRLAERLKGSVSLPSVTFSAFASLKLSMLDNRA